MLVYQTVDHGIDHLMIIYMSKAIFGLLEGKPKLMSTPD